MNNFDERRPGYFSGWESRAWACPECRWGGSGSDLSREFFDQLSELHCPKCDYKFGLLVDPSTEETRTAAQAGNARAQEYLRLVADTEAGHARLVEARNGRDHLPDIDGDTLEFTFHTDGGHDPMNPHWLVLYCGTEEIYREPSGFEYWHAIIDISNKLLARYPNRVAWIDPAEAGVYLGGDSMWSFSGIRGFLHDCDMIPPTGRWARHPITGYYTDWRERTWTCECGWSGITQVTRKYDDPWPTFVRCPMCSAILTEIPCPTDIDRRDGAMKGNREAIEGQAARGLSASGHDLSDPLLQYWDGQVKYEDLDHELQALLQRDFAPIAEVEIRLAQRRHSDSPNREE